MAKKKKVVSVKSHTKIIKGKKVKVKGHTRKTPVKGRRPDYSRMDEQWGEDFLDYTIEQQKKAKKYFKENEMWVDYRETYDVIESIRNIKQIKLTQKDIDSFPIDWDYDRDIVPATMVKYWVEDILKKKF